MVLYKLLLTKNHNLVIKIKISQSPYKPQYHIHCTTAALTFRVYNYKKKITPYYLLYILYIYCIYLPSFALLQL